MSTNSESDIDDENKIDFKLLQLRRPVELAASSSDSSIILNNDHSRAKEIWPLHLTAKFIDHYIIGDLVGSGSYAEVRECVDTRTLERCALKVINKEYLVRQAPRALANQMQEIRLLRHFRHANIIRMRECIHKGPFIYIALEFCSFNLNELLNEQPKNRFSLVLGRRFFHQLCFGLNYLHSIGIVHRDIKPDNLLLTCTGTVKIIDFGVSHTLSMWASQDWCSNYEGTPLFQAPEVISGQLEYLGFKVDVWSCGVTLFLMLYGTFPFLDESLLGLYAKILAQELEVPRGEPTTGALTDLLVMMLDKDWSRRASIREVLEHPWLKLCHANLHETDDEENVEFFDLVCGQVQSERSRTRDIYRSMTVLPYLYRHHFPHLPIRKSKSLPPTAANSGMRIEKLNPYNSLSSVEGAGASMDNKRDETISSAQTTTTSTTTTTTDEIKRQSNSSSSSSCQEELGSLIESDEDSSHIEWGTEQQYQLMKVPQVRANRVRRNSSSSSSASIPSDPSVRLRRRPRL